MEDHPKKKESGTTKWLLIVLSIVIGIVLSCAILPLGGFAILVASVGSADTETTLLPPKTWQERVVSGRGQDRVAIIEASGIIGAPDGGTFGGTPMHREVISQVEQATTDPQIRAVVLRIDSPGGGVVASSEIYNALKDLRAAEKPLVVSMSSMAASGGYYIATPASRIYANPDTLTGSLGVIISSLNYEEAFEKLGLRQVVFKSDEFKDILSPAREIKPEERKILQTIVDDAYQRFVDVIVEGRNLPREQVLKLADGRIYTGEQARDVGLVDELGNLDDAIAGARELAGLPDNAMVIRYQRYDSLYDLLFITLAKQQQPADPLGLRNLQQQQGPRLEYRVDWLGK
jgi:protease-4